jgi:hypothetical protein
MKRVGILVAVTALLSGTVPLGAQASDDTIVIERTPPYDYGDGAQDGTVIGAFGPCPGITYSLPPFPVVNWCHFGTAAGINVNTSEPRLVTAQATIRNTAPSDSVAPMWACFSYRPPGYGNGYRYPGLGCTPQPPPGEQAVVTLRLEEVSPDGVIDAGTHGFDIELRGWPYYGEPDDGYPVRGPSLISVERFTVTLSPPPQ